jgi:hypothetical protein
MIPFILAAIGGYLIGDSVGEDIDSIPEMAEGGDIYYGVVDTNNNLVYQSKNVKDAKLISNSYKGSIVKKYKGEGKIHRYAEGGEVTRFETNPPSSDFFNLKGERLNKKSVTNYFDKQKGIENKDETIKSIEKLFHLSKEQVISILKEYNRYAEGGEVKNQYAGRSAEDIWNNETENQRLHFLIDHTDRLMRNPKDYVAISKMGWDDLDYDVQVEFNAHKIMGQYEEGGSIELGNIKNIFDIPDSEFEKVKNAYDKTGDWRNPANQEQGTLEINEFRSKYPSQYDDVLIYLKREFSNPKNYPSYQSQQVNWDLFEPKKKKKKMSYGGIVDLDDAKVGQILIYQNPMDKLIKYKEYWKIIGKEDNTLKLKKCDIKGNLIDENSEFSNGEINLDYIVRNWKIKKMNGGDIEMAKGGVVYNFDVYLYNDDEDRTIKEKKKYRVKASSRNSAYDKANKKFPRPYFVELHSIDTMAEGGVMAKGGDKWIQEAVKNKGALRRTAKREGLIKGDEKLSMTDIKKLEKKGGKTSKRAHLAETLKNLKKVRRYE